MSGPTTEAINEDVKALRQDLHQMEVGIRADVQKLAIEVARIGTELGLFKWLLGLLLVLTLGGVASSIWWASATNTKLNAVDARLERIETTITRALVKPGA